MSGQLAVQSGTQSPKTVGKILFNRKLASQLSVDDLDQLMNGIVKVLKNLRDLLFWLARGTVRKAIRFFFHNSAAIVVRM